MEDEVLTIKEVADYLKMNERTIYKLVQNGKMPAAKIASQWRMKKDLINEWLEYHMKSFTVEDLVGLDQDHEDKVIQVTPILSKKAFASPLHSTSKSQVLKELVDLLVASGEIKDKDELFRAVVERERLCSTAIADEVAIPHPRHALRDVVSKPCLAIGISKLGIDFESEDDKPTRLFFLICAPREDIHLKIMARLSRILRDPKTRYDLIQAENFEQFVDIFSQGEKKLA